MNLIISSVYDVSLIQMLKKEKFVQLSMEEKEKLLLDVFEQIQTEDTNFDDVIFFLQSVSSIKEETLDAIYDDILHLLSLSKGKEAGKRKEYLKKIHQRLEDEARQDSADADKLLEDIV